MKPIIQSYSEILQEEYNVITPNMNHSFLENGLLFQAKKNPFSYCYLDQLDIEENVFRISFFYSISNQELADNYLREEKFFTFDNSEHFRILINALGIYEHNTKNTTT